MKRALRASLPSANSVLLIVALVAFVWTIERWRRGAAHTAERSSGTRLVTLARCLLGRDAEQLVREPDRVRQRLRALAMRTPPEVATTWFDPCVAVARGLAVHASEVDNTREFTAAQSRLVATTRLLYDTMRRVGLVWRVRAGDPEIDFDAVADRFIAVSIEIQLAGGTRRVGDAGSPVAPDVEPLGDGTLVAMPGLEPLAIGSPDRFFAGSPLPNLAELVRADGYVVHTLANAPASVWRVVPTGVARIDTDVRTGDDGLARLRFFEPGRPERSARVTPVTDPLAALHVIIDVAEQNDEIWFAQWTPWAGAAIAHFVSDQTPLAVALTLGHTNAAEILRDPVRAASGAIDEHVAIATLGPMAVAAYSVRTGPESSEVLLSTTLADGENSPVLSLGQRTVVGRTPAVEFCALGEGRQALVLAGAHQWRVAHVDAAGITDVLDLAAPVRASFDEHVVVRCEADGMVVYGRDHASSSPVLVCPARADRCMRSEAPASTMPSNVPMYVTRTPDGRALAHGAWPRSFVRAGGTLVAVRAVGPVVSVARKSVDAARWNEEQVVFDAAWRMHGWVVQGLEAYASGATVLIAVLSSDGLHLFRSDDEGAHWSPAR